MSTHPSKRCFTVKEQKQIERKATLCGLYFQLHKHNNQYYALSILQTNVAKFLAFMQVISYHYDITYPTRYDEVRIYPRKEG